MGCVAVWPSLPHDPGGQMGFAQVLSRAQAGLSAPEVAVEVHLGSGLPMFSIVVCWRPLSTLRCSRWSPVLPRFSRR